MRKKINITGVNKLAREPGVLENEDTGHQADYEEAEAVAQSIKGSSTERHEGVGTDREVDRMGKPWIEGKGTKGQGQLHTALQLAAMIYGGFFVLSSSPGRCPASRGSRGVPREGTEGVLNSQTNRELGRGLCSNLYSLLRQFSLAISKLNIS